MPFSGEGTQSATLQLQAGDVAFWTELDVEYQGNALLEYRIDLSQGGASVATAACNPLGQMKIKMGWLETDFGASHSRRGSGKMACTASLTKGGPTTVEASLAFGLRPATVTLNKANLVLKQ